jgi:hypothetical protein
LGDGVAGDERKTNRIRVLHADDDELLV